MKEDLRYRLIRALVQTVTNINRQLSTVKIVIAIRYDLLSRVFRYTRDTGDQEEKYKSLYLPLTWTKDDLEKLLDRRVNELIRRQYTTQPIKAKELLPRTIYRQEPIQYILDRTLYMPRDVISFFNECIKAAEGLTVINKNNVIKAEGIYSDERLRALADEWSADYPNLIPIVFILKKQKQRFKMDDWDMENVGEFMLNFIIYSHKTTDCFIYRLVEEYFNERGDEIETLIRGLFKIFYKVGILGVKRETYLPTEWSFQGARIVEAEISEAVSYEIHPAYWRVLGIKPV